MSATRMHRALLVASSLIAIAIGGAILLAPAQFHATHGIELAGNASLMSEVRAPGGALLLLGVLMGIGAFVPSWTRTSTTLVATVYLAYGVSRLFSLAVDGTPDAGLVGAIAVELLIGALGAITLTRTDRREFSSEASPRVPSHCGRLA